MFDRIINIVFLWMIPSFVLPNHITAFRFIATPPTLFLLAHGNYRTGVIVFLCVAFTDALDGALARTRNKITPWGMLFDPLADKLLIVPTIAILMIAHLSRFVAMTVIGTELLIIFLALCWRKNGKLIQANTWGKGKMILEVAGIIVLLVGVIFSLPFEQYASGILLASVVFGVISLCKYGI